MEEEKHLSISELADLLNTGLEELFPGVQFEGEVSQWTRAASGHLYLTLKDEGAQLPAVMWRSYAESLNFDLEEGLSVICTGRPNIYPRSGRFQIIVRRMEQVGEGALRKKFLQLKAKLEKEGLFDLARKRQIPFLPRAIGIVTSESGAAIHDIMTKIEERFPSVPVYLVDARVQGTGAAKEIAAGIEMLNEDGRVEVIIVGRGGGSPEDLWAFNEEPVVRAIFASQIPIISAVGHEVDISLSDLVADMRAPTPTAAGEMVVPSREEMLRQIDDLQRRRSDIARWMEPRVQAIDEASNRLVREFQRRLEILGSRINEYSRTIFALSPRNVLDRGYAIVHGPEGVLRDATMVQKGDALDILLADGSVGALVEKTHKGKKNGNNS